MLKHIIGQAIFQFLVVMILLFLGERFIPEYVDSFDSGVFAQNPSYKWHNGVVGGTVRSGRFYTVNGDSDYEAVYSATKIYSRHFTFIYNTFVMMQVFNFLNSRKLH
jgi:Ca2+ transporting ATPase